MGQKLIPRVIIWDEVCTVPRPTLETFLGWLEGWGVQIICCPKSPEKCRTAGSASGVCQQTATMKRWRLIIEPKNPFSKPSKTIPLRSDKIQCQKIRKAFPGCLGWERFVEAWRLCDLILTSRVKIHDRAQMLLFERHGEYFPDTS